MSRPAVPVKLSNALFRPFHPRLSSSIGTRFMARIMVCVNLRNCRWELSRLIREPAEADGLPASRGQGDRQVVLPAHPLAHDLERLRVRAVVGIGSVTVDLRLVGRAFVEEVERDVNRAGLLVADGTE